MEFSREELLLRYLSKYWPHILDSDFEITSPQSGQYNCFAWALSEQSCNLGTVFPDGLWPSDIPRYPSKENFIQLFQKNDFNLCANDDSLEEGFEKLVFYVDEHDFPTHVARQLQNGKWTSKLGPAEDIQHDSIKIFEGWYKTEPYYGKIGFVMKRLRPIETQ